MQDIVCMAWWPSQKGESSGQQYVQKTKESGV